MRGSKPAKRGFRYENIFLDLVNNNEEFNNSLRLYFGDLNKPLKAYKVSDTKMKTDVLLNFGDTMYGCSIKTSEIDFSQLDRRWLSDLAEKLNMDVEVYNMISECILNKMVNKRDKFILDKYKDSIINYFKSNLTPLLKELFVRDEDILKYLVVCFYIENHWYIARILDVFEYIESSEIYTTSRGILMFGDCLSMQRKSGDGRHVKIPKNHPAHPGNQLQFKLKPLSLVRNMPHDKIYKIYPND